MEIKCFKQLGGGHELYSFPIIQEDKIDQTAVPLLYRNNECEAPAKDPPTQRSQEELWWPCASGASR